MKKRFTEEKIIGFLREAEAGLSVKDLCHRHGFSEAIYYLWKAKFGGMGGTRCQAPEETGDRERTAKEAACSDDARGTDQPRGAAPKVVAVPETRELVRFAQSQGLSERRALKLACMSPSVLRYERRDDGNGELRERIVALAHRHGTGATATG